ncbi:DUF4154 domain-containing protein [Sulfurimonas aquatica]|uniref:DUF4154 domain-containing protein n=1 Tax=Sulfurimonas aquatica TaxID=2672570 RepID=A0A975GDB5_9BACT|nr:YfiR family protein [Sulfurimonas aquatica]QSZ42412.1 DUF4154 domain-containing protein [Sulfurimonas aquatica]
MLLKALILLSFISLPTYLNAISEDEIKQIYLEKFSMFIEWPQDIERFNICIYNDKKFAISLQDKYESKKFSNYDLRITPLSIGEHNIESKECNMLYIRNTNYAQEITFVNNISSENILIISDNYDDIYRGSMISFYLKDNKLKFVINNEVLKKASLKASYKLLKFAKVVQ